MAGSSGSAVVQRRVGFDAGDKVAVKLKVCCRRRSKRLETSLDNNDTKMPALGGYWYTRVIPQLISRNENLLSQGHGSLAPLWPESKYCWIPFLPDLQRRFLPFHDVAILRPSYKTWRLYATRDNVFFPSFSLFFRPLPAFQIIRRILFSLYLFIVNIVIRNF